ncbi:MAG: hypothetical protein JWR50_3519, partial [Mucilaginibacter sp.]|nr:hypothetical protein [Mucilaginibacter sp.]
PFCMPEFISKIQHNTYEKGEFSDEKARSLSETLQLIKDFPFDAERTLTEIQLTGPSVTIQDEYVNYLKVGLYFNGKLCVYYLDNENHLYECYLPNVTAVCDLVTDFFNGQLDLSKFEKHLFNIGSKKHFENQTFDYVLNKVQFYVRFVFTLVFLALFVMIGVVFTFINAPPFARFFFIPFCIFFDFLLLYTLILSIGYFRKSKNMYLHLSAGNNCFKFGTDEDIFDYYKTNISTINIYGNASSKGTPVFNIIEIVFIDKSKIEFPVYLIDQFLFESKFPITPINIVTKISELRKRRWQFAFN